MIALYSVSLHRRRVFLAIWAHGFDWLSFLELTLFSCYNRLDS